MFSFLPLINIVEGPFVHAHQILAITISLGCAAVAPACRIAQEKEWMHTGIKKINIYIYIFDHEMGQK